ncbi:MAG: hypothetical protein R2733_09870 [Acidimicrobiales bacterium]
MHPADRIGSVRQLDRLTAQPATTTIVILSIEVLVALDLNEIQHKALGDARCLVVALDRIVNSRRRLVRQRPTIPHVCRSRGFSRCLPPEQRKVVAVTTTLDQ